MKTIYKPILFSTPMVQAIISGTKTVTRRIVKDRMLQNATVDDDLEFLLLTVSQKFSEGDILWVRETWFSTRFDFKELLSSGITSHLRFKADGNYDPIKDCVGRSWKPSIHMPRNACRIFLKVIDVRIERLNEITVWGAEDEGVEKRLVDGDEEYKNYLAEGITEDEPWGDSYFNNPRLSFMSLWQSLNGPESWDLNPWVWVIEFERIEKPLDFI